MHRQLHHLSNSQYVTRVFTEVAPSVDAWEFLVFSVCELPKTLDSSMRNYPDCIQTLHFLRNFHEIS
jgi:hypothetical protein